MQLKRKRICIVATVPYALIMFMKSHIAMLALQYDVTLITNGTKQDMFRLLGDHIEFIPVKIERKISLWCDICALFFLYRIFRKSDFDAVHSLMPKTGLLTMLAAFFAGVPNRIHTFTGQVWANKNGLRRWALKVFDKIIALCSTKLLADSPSQRQFLIDEHVVSEKKIEVLGYGSVCGVNLDRFKPDSTARQSIRAALEIPEDAIVYLFLGRLNKDKGILDLAMAFQALAVDLPNVHLLIVGPDEGGIDHLLKGLLIGCSSQFHRVGYTDKPESYMACADVLCLPSYREGFGSVIIEAAAIGLPSVVSKIYGLIDAVVDGDTGILHQPKNVQEIKLALLTLANDEILREKMASQAKKRARTFFATDIVVSAMQRYYKALLD